MVHTYSIELGGRTITIESGHMAKQAHGAVTVRCGDSLVLVAACMSDRESNLPFFPLTVEYREKGYAAGKIPGSIFKREARPSDAETLSARLIDHQIRPLFPKGFKNEIQVIVSVLSHDQENDPDILACIGASVALSISKIPFDGPYGCVRVARGGESAKIVMPTYAEREESDCDIVVAGKAESLTNIEGEAHEIAEADMIDMMLFGHESIGKLIELQDTIVSEIGQPKFVPEVKVVDENLVARVSELASEKIDASVAIADKAENEAARHAAKEETQASLAEEFPDSEGEISSLVNDLAKNAMRERILGEGVRIDGRAADQVREITCEVGTLPRAHGSSLFTRGQTQALGSVTLGTRQDERLVDNLEGKSFKNYMLDYNFPPFSVGETRRIGPTNRREIGHGTLAEHAVQPVIPDDDTFPYTIRIVSDILESNGSSSMASVCAASLALMDAGVPIKCAIAGVNCGLISDGDRSVILTDLLGVEDANGDMDLKIAGSEEGITSFQMDIKIAGISLDLLKDAFEQARVGRLHVLGLMKEAITEPRPQLSRFAPRIITVKIDPAKIGAIIGPGGKVVREIQETTGATIEIEDDGTVNIASLDGEAGEAARRLIENIAREPKVGETFEGEVRQILPFGAVVEIYSGKDGLVHISEIAMERIDKVEDVVNLGDTVKVIIINVDPTGKVKLSMKRALPEWDGPIEDAGRGGGGGGRDRNRRPPRR